MTMSFIGDSDDADTHIPAPWPQLIPLLHFRRGHLICLGVPADDEARLSAALADHAQAHGERTLLYPTSPAAHELGARRVLRSRLTAQHIVDDAESFASTRRPVDLIVVEDFSKLCAPDGERLREPEEIDDAGRRLKRLADDLTVFLMVPVDRTPPAAEPMRLSDLGLGAELVYHADVLALLERTSPGNADVLVVKDRFGPVPYKASIPWES
ncbi:P-loop NTPase family protein [Streptomyces zaomyceticus]|uniref:hypothetical protein n=1 Tax=Streptomyces zaomyceticus TaxID=68286 RepID=UPI0036BF1C86